MSPELNPPKFPLTRGIEVILNETTENPVKIMTMAQFKRGLEGKYNDDQISGLLTYFAQREYIKIATDHSHNKEKTPPQPDERKLLPPDKLFLKDDEFYITAKGITAYHTWNMLGPDKGSFL